MAIKFIGTPEPEEEQVVSEETPKNVTADKEVKYSSANPHPAKGTYIKIPVDEVKLDGNMYLGVANTGTMGVTNIRFVLEGVDLGDGVERTLTIHSGWGNILVERTAVEQKAMGLLGKKSGLKVEELPGYTIENGKTNIETILGEARKKEEQ